MPPPPPPPPLPLDTDFGTIMRAALTDTFGRHHNYLRLSIGERCNLRCTYCMPAEGVPLSARSEVLSTAETLRLASLFAAGGATKLRLTGGEPLIRPDVSELAAGLRSMPGVESLGVTTNAMTLERQLPALHAAGVTDINISLDTLQPAKFEALTRRRGLERVLRAVEAATSMEFRSIKINCVAMRGVNDDEIAEIVALSRPARVTPLDVRFIEWMPFDSNSWDDRRFLPYEEMLALLEAVHGPDALARETDGVSDTSKWWRLPGHAGRVGFITSMSEHFCGSCNRLRITANGRLKVCLFGDESLSLRDHLRAGASDAGLATAIYSAVHRKHFAHGGMDGMHDIAANSASNRPMTLIGG